MYKRQVYNYDGDVIVKAGEKIETVVTGEDGRATFTADLPNDLTPEYGVMPVSYTHLDVYKRQEEMCNCNRCGNSSW